VRYRPATAQDLDLLADWNHQMIDDQGHDNPMTVPELRAHRRQGLGRAAMEILSHDVWPRDRCVVLEVLIKNEHAIAFWRKMGFKDRYLGMEHAPA
jgi:GNAT superfamily N-acetyltransferase